MRGQRTRLPGRRQSRKRELYKKLNVDRNLAYPSERTSLSKQPRVRSQTNTLLHFILFIGITETPFQKKKKKIWDRSLVPVEHLMTKKDKGVCQGG